ncbi:MAG TPA: restriction endonuclease subunit S [Pyrinomonadaceae bacterium]|nr:restriction endonuclease subunit S [Pyrinomonadaceae bacterium]
MELKPGYKQTEVGVIPEDWEVVPLGECLSTRPSYGINAPAVPFSDRLPVYIRITDITSDGRFLPGEVVSVDSALSGNYYLKDGDIIFARTGASVGKSYRYNPKDGPLVYAGFLIRVQPNAQKLLPAFAAAYVTTGNYWRWVRLMSMRSGQPGISGSEYSQLPIALPPLPEQRAIAEALSDMDELLSGLDRLIAKRRDLKQSAMQQLLTGQTRLPGFHGEWEIKSLAAICSMKSGEGITSADIDQFSAYPCYGGNGLRGFTSRFTHVGNYALIGRQGALCGNVYGIEGYFFASEHAIVVTAFATTDIRWLTYMLGTMNLNQYSESSAQPGLSVSKILKLDLVIPPTKDEQIAIAEVLSGMDAEIAALERRREKTHALKQAMMQELLTGRTRLVAAGASHA